MGTKQISKSAVDRAGALFRRIEHDPIRGVASSELTNWSDAYDLVQRYRSQWAARPYPLTKVDMGLRSMVRTAKAGDSVSQRLKRFERMITKLIRFPTMRLSQMEDVGGCRAVVPSLEALRRLQKRIHKNWRAKYFVREDDYIDDPKPNGYRACLVIVRRDGLLIEIQLRTLRQHRWASSVEYLEARTGHALRDGAGPENLRDGLALLAESLARLDQGLEIDPSIRDLIRNRFSIQGGMLPL